MVSLEISRKSPIMHVFAKDMVTNYHTRSRETPRYMPTFPKRSVGVVVRMKIEERAKVH